MNELVTRQQETELTISTETKELVQSSITDSTLKRFSNLHHRVINPLPRISANKRKGFNNEHLWRIRRPYPN